MPSSNLPLDSAPVSTSESNAVFVTDHLALAVFLASCGHEPALVAMRSGKILFRFTSTPALNVAVLAFNDGTAQVDPAAYDAARIHLRKQMDALLGGVR